MLMEPKKHILWVLLSLIGWYSPAQARDSVNVKSAVKEATLFFEGAHLTRNGSVNLTAGEHLLIFDDLPYGIELSSLQFKPLDGMEVKSVRPLQYRMKSNLKSKAEKQIEKQLDSLDIIQRKLILRIEVLKSQRYVIERNTEISPSKLTVEELKSLSDFYSDKIGTIETEIIDIDQKLIELNKASKEFYKELNKLATDRLRPGCKVYVDVRCKSNLKGDVQLNYFTVEAGWIPKYDFHVSSISMPLSIIHKADVFQKTGEHWDNIKLKVSNVEPNSSQSIPNEKVWKLDKKYPYDSQNDGKRKAGALTGQVMNLETGEPVSYALVQVLKDNSLIAKGISDKNGVYLIRPIFPGKYDLVCNYVGISNFKKENIEIETGEKNIVNINLSRYQPLVEKDVEQKVYKDEIAHMPVRSTAGIAAKVGGVYVSDDGSSLNLRSSRSQENYYYIDGIRVRGSSNVPQQGIEEISVLSGGIPASYGELSGGVISNSGYYNSSQSYSRSKVSTNQINSLETSVNITHIEYELKEPYSLQSDGLNSEIELLESVVEAEYVYHVYPSINNEAYLIANIPEFGQLNLLKAEASIYYESAYVGKTEISPSIVKDTLELSVGKDSKIVAHKEINKEFNKQIFLKKGYRKELGWSVSVKNEHAEAINLVIHDQIPISKSSNIEIELVELSGGEPDEKGLIEWKEYLASGQSIEKKLLISAKVSTN